MAQASLKALTEIVETGKVLREQIALLDIPIRTCIDLDKLACLGQPEAPGRPGQRDPHAKSGGIVAHPVREPSPDIGSLGFKKSRKLT